MEFSWLAFFVTAVWKVVEGFVSYREGTFSRRQLEARGVPLEFHQGYRWAHRPMSFLNNWAASWGAIVIFPLVNALAAPIIFFSKPVYFLENFPFFSFVVLPISAGMIFSYFLTLYAYAYKVKKVDFIYF